MLAGAVTAHLAELVAELAKLVAEAREKLTARAVSAGGLEGLLWEEQLGGVGEVAQRYQLKRDGELLGTVLVRATHRYEEPSLRVELTGPDGCYLDRMAHWHRWMGPPEVCPDRCYGRDWYYDEVSPLETYCDCPAGQLRRELEK